MKNKIEKDKMADFAPQMYSVLKELQESASYWSEYDVPLGIVDRINDVLKQVENDTQGIPKAVPKRLRSEWQKERSGETVLPKAQVRNMRKT